MAKAAGANCADFIDLTEDDDYRNCLKSSSSAPSRAQAAASRLQSHTGSFNPHDFLVSRERDLALGNARNCAEKCLQEHRKDSIRIPTPPRYVGSGTRWPTLASNDTGSGATTGRMLQSPALGANISIARDFEIPNPLEERLQASVATLKERGRPSELEWTPTMSGSSRASETPQKLGKVAANLWTSPSTLAYKALTTNSTGNSTPTGATEDHSRLKRKHSRISTGLGSLSKAARTVDLVGIAPPPKAELLDTRNQIRSPSYEPSLKNDNKDQPNILSSDPAPISTPFPTGPMVPQDKLSPSLDKIVTPTEVFNSLLYSAIQKRKKRHKGSLSCDQLDLIAKSVAQDVLEDDLKLYDTLRFTKPDDTWRKKIKRFVKKDFSRKVTFASRMRSADSGVIIEKPLNQNNPFQTANIDNDSYSATKKISKATRSTNLAGYQDNLESEALERASAVPESVHATNSQSEALQTTNQLRNSGTQQLPRPITNPLATAPAESELLLDEPFPPGFDRGRFPAQRRRRGNKFYTPERQRTASNKDQVKPAPFAQQPSRQVSPNRKATSKLSEAPKAPKISQTSYAQFEEATLSRMLAERAYCDQRLHSLLKTVASGTATKLQTEKLQECIDDICAMSGTEDGSPKKGPLESSLRELPVNDLSPGSTGAVKIPHQLSGDVQHPMVSEKLINRPERQSEDQSTAPLPNRSIHGSSATLQCFVAAGDPKERNQGTLQRIASSTMAHPATERTPVHRQSSTAFDPELEFLLASSTMSGSRLSPPCSKRDGYSIDYNKQEELVVNQNLLIYVDSSPEGHNTSIPEINQRKLVRIETKVVDPARRPERSSSSLLRHRELGSGSGVTYVNTQYELRLRNSEMLQPWKSWKGASGDIVAAAWASNSTTYAVGAAAHTNVEDLQYNRPCNLLLGELASNILTELPDHRVNRPKPETISTGPNASQAVYDACDPMVYQTVTSIAFAPSGTRMYTASHDRTVKVWNTSMGQCQATLKHDAFVTSIEASSHREGLFATATKTINNSIRIYYSHSEDTENCLLYSEFSSFRAKTRPDRQIYPECLRWGPTQHTSHLLLAGFQEWSEDANKSGQLILWDAHAFNSIKVSPSSQSIYTAAWHPHSPLFATGGAPGNLLTNKKSTKSVVRIWDYRATKRYTIEYECSARDMQDVTFSPTDSNIVTAGCTDGSSFVWDFRRPDQILHRLRHGRPLVDWDHTRDREEADTGVMMSLWALGGNLFYTGSSDGVIKAWDVKRHPADVLVRNVAQFGSGVQSGALSADGTNLLVGDADGGFHILSSAPCGPRAGGDDPDLECKEGPINLVRAPDGSGLKLGKGDDEAGTEGKEAGRELIESEQLQYDPDYGVTKGPNYRGPYARDSRKEASRPSEIGRLLPHYAELQAFPREGEENEEIARKRRGIIKARKFLIDNEFKQRFAVQGIAKATAASEEQGREQPTSSTSQEQEVISLGAIQASLPLGRGNFMSQDPKVVELSDVDDGSSLSKQARPTRSHTFGSIYGAKNNIIPGSRMVEENYWWPRFAEDEIAKAREKAGQRRG